jgi:hypothetical protein
MKVYLSTNKPEGTSGKWANSLPMLDGILLNSEGTDIVCDHFISSFSINEYQELLKKLATKLRLNGKLTITDIDMNILARRKYNEEIDEDSINAALFSEQKRKSVSSLISLEGLLPPNLYVEQKHYDHQTCNFTIVARRKS